MSSHCTSHALYYLPSPASYFLLSTLMTRTDTVVVAIDPCTGAMHHRGIANIDLFPSEADAVEALGGSALRLMERFPALLGYVHCGTSCYFAVATKVSCEMQVPPNHSVYSVEQTKWVKMSLGYTLNTNAREAREESDNTKLLSELDLSELHFYYCETYDLSHRFPNANTPGMHEDVAFVWNEKITQHFQEVGLRFLCAVLLQGLAMSLKTTEGDLMNEVEVALIVRKETTNPKTRHLGRGFSYEGCLGTGNEAEVEMLLWTRRNETTDPTASMQNLIVKWGSVVWRRGTVPLWWKTNVYDHGAIIIDDQPHHRSEEYWKRLLVRYGSSCKLRGLSLLYTAPSKAEKALGDAYLKSVDYVKSTMNINLSVQQFDWHTTYAKHGLDETASQLWRTMMRTVKDSGMSVGTMKYSEGPSPDIVSWTYEQTQRGVLRVNCLDSLDRTNMVTFLLALKVVPELCRNLGVEHFRDLPQPVQPWPLVNASMETLKASYGKAIMHNLVVLFIANGDIMSHLYTGSPAMFTQNMRGFTSEIPAPLNDLLIGIQRKFSNVFEDKRRTAQYELLLGQNVATHFPETGGMYTPPRQLLSYTLAGSFVANAPALEDPTRCSKASLIELRDTYSIAPVGIDCVEYVITLPQLCQVSELVLTIRHAPQQSVPPVEMDMFVGQRIDDASPVYQGLRLPWCEDKTKLHYFLPSHVSGVKEAERICTFSGSGEPLYVRVVVLVFFGSLARQRMTIGNVQIFGRILRPNDAEHHARVNERLAKALEEVNELMIQDATPEAPDVDRQGLRVEALATLYGVQDTPLDSDDDEDDWEEVPRPTLFPGSFTTTTLQTSFSGYQTEEYKQVREFMQILLSQFSASYPAISFTMALEVEAHRLRLGVSARRRDSCYVLCGFSVAAFDPNSKIAYRDPKVEESQRSRLKSNMCSNASCRKTLMMLTRNACVFCRMSFCSKCVTTEKVPIVEYDWPTAAHVLCATCKAELAKQRDLVSDIHKLQRQAPFWLEKGSVSAPDPYVSWLRLTGVTERQRSAVRLLTYSSEKNPKDISTRNCCILSSALSSMDGLPMDVVLEPTGEWRSRDGVTVVEVSVMLPATYVVTGLVLHDDSHGRRRKTVLNVRVEAGETLSNARTLTRSDAWVVHTNERSVFNFPQEFSARVVFLHIRVAEGCATPFVHFGHLEIVGYPPAPEQRVALEPDITGPNPMPYVSMEQVLVQKQRYSTEHRTLQIDVKNGTISGFRIENLSKVTSSGAPQVKVVRVMLRLRGEGSDMVSQVWGGVYVIPMTPTQFPLIFPFQKTYRFVQSISFEFLQIHEKASGTPTFTSHLSKLPQQTPFYGNIVLLKATNERLFEAATGVSGSNSRRSSLSPSTYTFHPCRSIHEAMRDRSNTSERTNSPPQSAEGSPHGQMPVSVEKEETSKMSGLEGKTLS